MDTKRFTSRIKGCCVNDDSLKVAHEHYLLESLIHQQNQPA